MNVKLETLTKKDLKNIVAWLDPNIFRIFSHPVDEQQLEKLLPKYKRSQPVELGFKAVDTNKNEIVGVIHFILNHKNNYTHIGQIVVGEPDLRGRGIGAEILKQTLTLCFTKYKLHHIQLFVAEDNEIAISCYKKVGFKIEGLIRDSTKLGEKYISMYCMSILEDEWEK